MIGLVVAMVVAAEENLLECGGEGGQEGAVVREVRVRPCCGEGSKSEAVLW